MKCPVCRQEMTREDFDGVAVDVCKHGCKGIFLDFGEMSKLKQENDGMSLALQEALNAPRRPDSGRGRIQCPRCSTPMQRHPHFEARDVVVDECYVCGGFFLDSGELKVVREARLTDEQRQKLEQALLAQVPQFQQEMAQQEAQKAQGQDSPDMSSLMRLTDSTWGL
jgi:Zn-finger nucleic acid-binding protein